MRRPAIYNHSTHRRSSPSVSNHEALTTGTKNRHRYSVVLENPFRYFLFKTRSLWQLLPGFLRQSPLGLAYAWRLNEAVRTFSKRKQYFATYFLRNRPELELMRRIVDRKPEGSEVSLTVIGCSKGPEVYSISWTLRRARPDLRIKIRAVDISPEILEFAKNGIYSRAELRMLPERRNKWADEKNQVHSLTGRDQIESLFERLTSEEVEDMFDMDEEEVRIKPWLKEGIEWIVGDASSDELRERLGLDEIVVANRFLCHMRPCGAERCLRAIGNLVKPGGYLFVSGVDLDVRTKVAVDSDWKAISELRKEMHEGDSSLLGGWPLGYWSLEPIDETRPDWHVRYASAFRVGEASESSKELTYSRVAREA